MKNKSSKKQIIANKNVFPTQSKQDILTSRQWREVPNYVEERAKTHACPTNNTNELMTLILAHGLSVGELIRLNIGDLPCSHREPHIVVIGRYGKIRQVYLDENLETKIKEYVKTYRKGAGPKKPLFVSGRDKKRTSRETVYSKFAGQPKTERHRGFLGLGKKLGIPELSASMFRKTVKYQVSGEEGEDKRKRAKSKKKKWTSIMWPEYISATEAIKLAHNNNRKLTMTQLSKILKPDGPMRYMRKEKPGRCKVHVRDFMKFIETLTYIKPKGDQIPDEQLAEYMADKEAQQAEIREQKESHSK